MLATRKWLSRCKRLIRWQGHNSKRFFFAISPSHIAYIEVNSKGVIHNCQWEEQSSWPGKQAAIGRWCQDDRPKPCWLVLHPLCYQSRLTEAPEQVPLEEWHAAMQWKMTDLFNKECQWVYGLTPLPEEAFNGRRRMLYIQAVEQEWFATLYRSLSRRGFVPQGAFLTELLVGSYVAEKTTLDTGLAVLVISHRCSWIYVYCGQQLFMSREVDLGAEQLLAAFAQQQAPTHQLATEDDRLGRFNLDIQRSLDYFESQVAQRPVSQLMIFPHDTLAEQLIATFSQQLNVQVDSFPLASNQETEKGFIDTALAWALSQADMNLLHVVSEQKKRRRITS